MKILGTEQLFIIIAKKNPVDSVKILNLESGSFKVNNWLTFQDDKNCKVLKLFKMTLKGLKVLPFRAYNLA